MTDSRPDCDHKRVRLPRPLIVRARFVIVTSLIALFLFARTSAAQQATTLTDQREKTFLFSEPASRVVTIAIPLFWTFLTVDGSDTRVIGANAVALAQMRDGIVARVFPRSAGITTEITRGGTFTPNIEALLALRPDAVFQWADRGDELINALDRVGLRAIGVKNTSSESDSESWIHMSGVVAGKAARADSIIQWMQAGNQRYESLTAEIPTRDRPRVLMLVEYSRTIRIDGPTSYSTPMLRRAGARNVATTDGNVSIEEALAWNPDVILLSAFESKTPADLMADARWGKTKAAYDRRVYKLPFGVTRWGGYGAESPLFLGWLTNLLQPARFNLPLRDEMRTAYRTLFNFEATDADLDRVLQMKENAASAGYERFANPTAR